MAARTVRLIMEGLGIMDLSELRWDGDTTELDDGRMLRLRIVPDDLTIEDIGETYGQVAWSRNGDCGPVRPDGFTGRAEIMVRDGRSSLWWEPYWDASAANGGRGPSFDTKAERRMIADILEYGFSVFILEVCDGTDAYGHPIVVDVASMGGIEPFANGEYVESVVADLYAELDSVHA